MKRVLIALVVLSGCTGFDYFNANYDGHPVHSLTIDGLSFVIIDNQDLNKLAIGPGRDRGFAQGVSMGLNKTPEAIYKSAAKSYLASTGRNCSVSDPLLVLEPVHEITYRCD